MSPRPLPPAWQKMADTTGKPWGTEGGAYSSDCFKSWVGCVRLLRERGATLTGAEEVLRSKHMRWCRDAWNGRGLATVKHFGAYLDTSPDARAMAGITDGPNGEHPAKVALDAAQSAGTRFASAMMGALDALPDDAAHAAARVALRSRIEALTLAINLGAVFEALPAGAARAKGARK